MERPEIRDDLLSTFLEIMLARKILVILGIISVVATTAIGIYFMPSVYTSSTRIIVSPPALPKGDMPFLSDLKNSLTFVSNQRELIRSKLIYEKVAIELRLFEKTGPDTFFNKIKKKYFKIDYEPIDAAIDYLYRNTSVDILRGTNIIQITASAGSSIQAAEIANSIARNYIRYMSNLFYVKGQSAYKYIESEVDIASDRLRKAQANLDAFNEKEKIISLVSLENALIEETKKLSELEQEHENIVQKIQSLEAGDVQEVTEVLSEKTPAADGNQSGITTTASYIENELKKTRAELADTLSKKTENHPDVRRLRSQMEILEKAFAREQEKFSRKREDIEREKVDFAKEKNELLSKQKQQKSKQMYDKKLENLYRLKGNILKKIEEKNVTLKKLAINASEMTRLVQEVNLREKDYLLFREHLENARILNVSEPDQEGSSRVVDPARPPPFPDSKKKLILFAVGLMGSVLFGVGMAFIAEYFDDSFRNRNDAENYLNLTILGVIPPINRRVLDKKTT